MSAENPTPPAIFANYTVEPHIPHGSGDAEFRIVDGDTVIAVIDPDMAFYDRAQDLAFLIVGALRGVHPYPVAADMALRLVERAVEDWPEFTQGEDDVNGGDLVEWMGNWLEEARAVIANKRESADAIHFEKVDDWWHNAFVGGEIGRIPVGHIMGREGDGFAWVVTLTGAATMGQARTFDEAKTSMTEYLRAYARNFAALL